MRGYWGLGRLFAQFARGGGAALLALGIAAGVPVWGHEIRPALLELTQQPDGRYEVLWKQPSMGDLAVHLVPHISGGLLDGPPSSIDAGPGFVISRWRQLSAGDRGLDGRMLSIEGLNETLIDVLVSIRTADGSAVQQLLVPGHAEMSLGFKAPHRAAVEFLLLGIRHIATGPDHLLFLLGLMLIVRNGWALLKTVTSFTLAHSLTLAVATLGGIRLSLPLIDALIGLSILFIAPEALRAQRGGTSLSIRHPWAVAFAFGLVHGTGFANGLQELGLSHGDLLRALLFFNLGVESGQLAFIAAVLAVMGVVHGLNIRWPRPVELFPAYVIGSLGAFWTIRCAAAALGAT